MEPSLTDGANPYDSVDMMNWGSTSIPTAPTWPDPFSNAPLDFELPEASGMQTYDQLWATGTNNVATEQQLWANWQDIENAMMIDTSANDNTFGNPGFGTHSPALSVNSMPMSVGSGASSNHSWSSWRGRSRIQKVFSRSSSIAGRAKSAMKAGMSSFTLNGAKKQVSPSPRRTGKVADVVREGMRRLKGPGACWMCKILRKSCDPGDPCKECASSSKLAWQEVGCQRGAFSANYKPTNLCPSADAPEADCEVDLSEEEDWVAKQAEANLLWDEEMRAHCAEVGATRLRIHQKNYSPHFGANQLPVLHLKQPALKQQVVKAMRELGPTIEEPKRKQEVFMLLYHASLYQESLSEQTCHPCHLVLLSIRSLNHSLDARRNQPSPTTLHRACKPPRCGLHFIAKLQQSSAIYIDALHEVMFSKWGFSAHRYWWLAIFYSLCIQSLVRLNLMDLQKSFHVPSSGSNAKGYLHSFISLFEAASADFDPIIMGNHSYPAMSEVILARIAVNPWHWEEQGVYNSYDHLRPV